MHINQLRSQTYENMWDRTQRTDVSFNIQFKSFLFAHFAFPFEFETIEKEAKTLSL